MAQKLKVESIGHVSDRVCRLTLVSADGAPLEGYEAGAHLDFELDGGMTRSYSLVDFATPARMPDNYTIAVQREDDGEGGSLAMHGLKPGDILSATAPKNDFRLHDGEAPAVLIAGGIGVTPIISFATELTRRGTDFAFHYATRSADLCTFRTELQGHFAGALSLWHDDSNPIDLGTIVDGMVEGAHVYCCGPKGMIEAVRERAEAAGIAKDHVHFELFSSPDSHAGDQQFEVEISDTGQVFTIPAGKTIIEVLEDEGVDVMYDCQRGDCGICQTDVISGEPDHRDVVLSDAERASGKVMQICVSRAKSARLVLDI